MNNTPKKAFTLFEMMIVLAIAMTIMAMGIMWFRRQAPAKLRRATEDIQTQIMHVRGLASSSACPIRIIPCRDTTCAPSVPPYAGYAFQIFCSAPAAPPAPPCNQNCTQAGGAGVPGDGYDNWDFFDRPRFLDPELEFFAINLDNSLDAPPGTAGSGLIFPTSLTTPIALSPLMPALPSDPTQFVMFIIGIRGETPIGNPANLGYRITINTGGNAAVVSCAGGC